MKNIHPGIMLKTEIMQPKGVSNYKLSKNTGLSQTAISQITKGDRAITAKTALKISKYLGLNATELLMGQSMYDVEIRREQIKNELDKIQHYETNR